MNRNGYPQRLMGDGFNVSTRPLFFFMLSFKVKTGAHGFVFCILMVQVWRFRKDEAIHTHQFDLQN